MNKRRHNCHSKAIRKELLEDFVIQQIQKNIMNDISIEALSNKVYDNVREMMDGSMEEINLLTKRKAEIKTKLDRGLQALMDGIIPSELIKDKTDGLNSEMKGYDERIAFLKSYDDLS